METFSSVPANLTTQSEWTRASVSKPDRRRGAGARRLLQLTLALFGPTLFVAPVIAAPTAAERETARGLMAEGDRLAASGELRSALQRYQSAHAIMRVPTTGIQLATTQAKLGLIVEARAVAIEVVNLPAVTGEPRVFVEARQSAKELAAQLEPRVPSLTTTVTPSTAAFTLSVDGVVLPSAARTAPYRTNPGTHVVRIDAPGYEPQSLQVELTEGQAHAVAVALKPLPLSAAEVSGPALQSTTAAAPDRTLVSNEAAGPGRVRGIIGLSVGGAAFVLGAVTGIMSAVKVSDIKDHCSRDACDRAQAGPLSSANTLANVANVSIPLGVIGIGYGLYELLTLPRSDRTQARANDLRIAIHGTGIVIGGSL